MRTSTSIKSIHRVLLLIAGLALFATIFIPIWRIELDAAQYPEGLELLIYSNKLAGDVEIINGLNHYIGMKTLHVDDFVEFRVLPYILAAFAISFVLLGLWGRPRPIRILLGAFILFGIVAMADFWMWEYDYGHHLDPSAPIKVPGMAYQPPLIGFKQLLNFGALSIPDIGGWIIVAAGIILFYCVVADLKSNKSNKTSV